MKIELKNIHYSEHLSEETSAFSANLYIDGVKAGVASNRGHGGPTDYMAHDDKGRQLIRDAEAYCEKLPPEKFSAGGTEYELEMNLEHYIDNLLHAYLVQKDIQKFRSKVERTTKEHIVFGLPDQSFRALRLKFPIELLLVSPNGRNILKDILASRIAPELKNGQMLLNTNIPEQLLKESGLKPEQYVSQEAAHKQDKKPIRKNSRKL